MTVRIILTQGNEIIREMVGQVVEEGDLTRLLEYFWKGHAAPWGVSQLHIEKH